MKNLIQIRIKMMNSRNIAFRWQENCFEDWLIFAHEGPPLPPFFFSFSFYLLRGLEPAAVLSSRFLPRKQQEENRLLEAKIAGPPPPIIRGGGRRQERDIEDSEATQPLVASPPPAGDKTVQLELEPEMPTLRSLADRDRTVDPSAWTRIPGGGGTQREPPHAQRRPGYV